jgi:hypothetical protein
MAFPCFLGSYALWTLTDVYQWSIYISLKAKVSRISSLESKSICCWFKQHNNIGESPVYNIGQVSLCIVCYTLYSMFHYKYNISYYIHYIIIHLHI